MKLTDLDPKFAYPFQIASEGTGRVLSFQCPGKCCEVKERSEHTLITVHFANPINPTDVPNPRGWLRTGTDFESISLSPSINVEGAHTWHGFVTNGEVITV